MISDHASYVTDVVEAYTTFCPFATHITYGNKISTVTASEIFTITNCPFTITHPVFRTTPTAPAFHVVSHVSGSPAYESVASETFAASATHVSESFGSEPLASGSDSAFGNLVTATPAGVSLSPSTATTSPNAVGIIAFLNQAGAVAAPTVAGTTASSGIGTAPQPGTSGKTFPSPEAFTGARYRRESCMVSFSAVAILVAAVVL